LLLRLIDDSGVRLDEQLGAFVPGRPVRDGPGGTLT
jgi:hypothetical protein